MLNELLQGQQTLNPEPASSDPYRVPVEPEESRICVSCQSTFKTKRSSEVAQCIACHVSTAELLTARDSRMHAEAEERFRRANRNRKIVRWVSLIAIVIAGGAFKIQMRKARREMHAAAHGWEYSDTSDTSDDRSSPSPAFAQRVERLAHDMCECTDTTCAQTVQGDFESYTRSSANEVPDEDRDVVAASIEKLEKCRAQVWAKAPPRR